MCGSTSAEKQTQSDQSAFYQDLANNYKTNFGQSQAITGALTKTFMPILNAGPSQEGYSPAEKTALDSQATEGTAQRYAQAQTATQQAMAAEGGGNAFLPSGGNAQLTAENANAAAGAEAAQRTNILTNDYATGRQNFQTAAQDLGETAGLVAPGQAASSATSAGSAASQTENNVANQQNSIWQAPFSAAAGIAGNLTYSSGAGFGLGKGW